MAKWRLFARHCSIVISAVQCSAVQCSAVQCSSVQCSAVQFSAVLCARPLCALAVRPRAVSTRPGRRAARPQVAASFAPRNIERLFTLEPARGRKVLARYFCRPVEVCVSSLARQRAKSRGSPDGRARSRTRGRSATTKTKTLAALMTPAKRSQVSMLDCGLRGKSLQRTSIKSERASERASEIHKRRQEPRVRRAETRGKGGRLLCASIQFECVHESGLGSRNAVAA